MTKEDILRLRDTAEQTKVQFKERVNRENKYDVSCEMVAQSNYRGGMIVVGIDDKRDASIPYHSKRYKKPRIFWAVWPQRG